ncbi:hypothetical protein BESB_025500 [Besnoitia besnoiti]|uniref:Uncharacterized protein n=1 Tax=Besnoitia besnoiti TaxID=94643 RepID=A0A2A9M6R0_BESBE|nr:uncharacterized protein BESB_025500 [Besnoitia besnoiti]PFH31576.1 hypothetical protein BESB_025500 [Besnoitia besnoiti]
MPRSRPADAKVAFPLLLVCSLRPAVVPGLEGLYSSVIATSNEAVLAFAPCQVYGLWPRLLPLPGSTQASSVLHIRLSALPVSCDSVESGRAAFCFVATSRATEAGREGNDQPMPATGSSSMESRGETKEGLLGGSAKLRSSTRGRRNEAEHTTWQESLSAPETHISPSRCANNLEGHAVLVHFRPVGGFAGELRQWLSPPPANRLGDSCAYRCGFRDGLPAIIAPGEVMYRTGAPDVVCECPPLPGQGLLALPSRAGRPRACDGRESSSASTCSSSSKSVDNLPHRSFFEPESPEEEQETRALYATKKAFDNSAHHIFPYHVEVSIDGGCCWSMAEQDVPRAVVLFANFPRRVTHVTPNNISVDGGVSLRIFLDYLPPGAPEDELVVRFTCVRRGGASAISSQSARALANPALFPTVLSQSPPSRALSCTLPGSCHSLLHRALSSHDDDRAASLAGRPTPHADATSFGAASAAAACRKWACHTDVGRAGRRLPRCASESCLDWYTKSAQEGDTTEAQGREEELSYSIFVPARIVIAPSRADEATSPLVEDSAEKGKPTLAVQCLSPALDETVLNEFDTFVDVGLNGVHFTESPQRLHVVDVQILGIYPDVGSSVRETLVHIQANDCFESEDAVVLLRFPDATEQVLPAHVDVESHRISFVMPPAITAPARVLAEQEGAGASGQVVDAATRSPRDDSQWNGNMKGQLHPTSYESSDGVRDVDETPPGEDSVESFGRPPPAGHVSVFLSFNGQVFSRSAARFTHYCEDVFTANAVAYTVSENGDHFEAELDTVLAPQTRVVVSLPFAVASNSAQARLTVLRACCPSASEFLRRLNDDAAPSSPAGGAATADGDRLALSSTGATNDVDTLSEEAIDRVLFLPATIDMNPQPLALLPDPNRSKRKPLGSGRAIESQRGRAGASNATAGRAKAKAATGGGSGAPHLAPAGAGTGPETKSVSPGLGGSRETSGGAAGRSVVSAAGGAPRAKTRGEKADGARPESAEESVQTPTLTVYPPGRRWEMMLIPSEAERTAGRTPLTTEKHEKKVTWLIEHAAPHVIESDGFRKARFSLVSMNCPYSPVSVSESSPLGWSLAVPVRYRSRGHLHIRASAVFVR